MGLAYMLTPKHAANGFYFAEDRVDILGSAENFALKLNKPVDKVEEEMTAFVSQKASLQGKRAETIMKMDMTTYWKVLGRHAFPALHQVAKSISTMICSSAAAERTWSTFRFVLSRLRIRLTNERVEKLVFICINSVLLD
jgi:hypothetical protein